MTDSEARRPLSEPAVDWAAARRNIPGGPEGVRRLAGVMSAECRRLVDEIDRGLAAGSASQVRAAAHTLCGGARHFGARRLVDVAGRMEDRAAAGDLDAVLSLFPSLETEGRRFADALGAGDAQPGAKGGA